MTSPRNNLDISAIIAPGQVFEIRALVVQGPYGAPYTASGYFDDPAKALEAVAKLPPCKGVYYTPNPVKPELLSRRANRLDRSGKSDASTGNHEIDRRRWLLVDIDPDRPTGICASDVEKATAVSVGKAILETLTAEGWPEPIVCDSGNGMQLMFPIDLPADDGGLCERATKAIAGRFDTEDAHVDQSVHNAARIWRMPGTWNRKGDNTPDRPHRMARIITMPEVLVPIPTEVLEAFAPMPEPVQAKSITANTSAPEAGRGWTQESFTAVINTKAAHLEPGTPEPYRGGIKMKLGKCLKGHPDSAIVSFNDATGAGYKCLHNSCAGDHWQEFRAAIDPRHTTRTTTTAPAPADKPRVLLPADGFQTLNEAARELGSLLAQGGDLYRRGDVLVRVSLDGDVPRLTPVKVAELPCEFERVAQLGKPTSKGDIDKVSCKKTTAELIAASRDFLEQIPSIRLVAPCPVITEQEGRLRVIHGYDSATGIYAGGKAPESVPLPDAVPLLLDIVSDFDFATPADRARAIAAMVTPALVFGGMLGGRAPLDLGEADGSQSGKGFRHKKTTAIYNQRPRTVTQGKSGVGGLEEQVSAALIAGANFIALDNVRGKIDSPFFEALLTEDRITARAAYSQNVEVDPSRVVMQMTSNKADLTPDLANRSGCVRIRKRPMTYAFRKYPEGDVLDHVRANQSRYLGAVFAVVRAWHDAGKPITNETRHDFRRWAKVLDWITRNVFNAGPLLDGHDEARERMTNPVLNWLRDVALEVQRFGSLDHWLSASDLLELLEDTSVELPLPDGRDANDPDARRLCLQAMGRKLGCCFRSGDVASVDGMTIERDERHDPVHARTIKFYRFTAQKTTGGKSEAIGEISEAIGGKQDTGTDSGEPEAKSPMAPPMASPMEKPIKTPISPITPEGTQHFEFSFDSDEKAENKYSIEASGEIGVIGETKSPEAPAFISRFDATLADDDDDLPMDEGHTLIES